MTAHDMPSGAMTPDCIRDCLQCHSTCEAAVMHCLETGGSHVEAAHVALLLDCADICRTSAHFMMHDSPHHTRLCEVCAEVCEACADDCERLSDEVMRNCAEACRRCAASCHAQAGAVA
jgi:hypothetical protein